MAGRPLPWPSPTSTTRQVPQIEVPVLEGSLVRLEPLAVRHADDLAEAAEEDRGSYGFTMVPRGSVISGYLDEMFGLITQRLIPFAQVRRADGRAVGCTASAERSPRA